MTTYTPDVWEVISIKGAPTGTMYKVLAGWSGGYCQGDSWKISSPIESMEETDSSYIFHNLSGSTYVCHKTAKRTSMLTEGAFQSYVSLVRTHGATMEIEDTLDDLIAYLSS